MAHLTRSLPDFSLRLGVDSENKVSVDVWLHGGRDDHVLSWLQTVKLDEIPLGGVSLRLLQGPVSPEEAVAQASLWCLERINKSEEIPFWASNCIIQGYLVNLETASLCTGGE